VVGTKGEHRDCWKVGTGSTIGDKMPAFWIVLAVLLVISSSLNAYQVVVVDDPATRVFRAALSLALLFGAALSVRKWLRELEQ
jgi:hypothetical protein